MDRAEVVAFKKGDLKCGLLVKNNTILFLWQFCDKKGRPVITMDTPFDARIIPDIKLYDVMNTDTRYAIEIHCVDTATNKIKALRHITMPYELTVAFMSAVQDQLTTKADPKQLNIWMQQQPVELIKTTKNYDMGT